MIFGRKKGQREEKDDDDGDEEEEEGEELDLIAFQGAFNGMPVDWKVNAKLAQVGLERAKIMVSDGIRRRANIIRIEHKADKAGVFLVIDGIPYPANRLSRAEAVAITQVMKLLAGLNMNEKSTTQSGGMTGILDEKKYTLFVETSPMGGGLERLVVRVIDQKVVLEKPEQLGFSTEIRKKIREFTSNKQKLTLAAGPRASGVTSMAWGIVKGIDVYLYSVHLLGEFGHRDTTNLTPFKQLEGDSLDATIPRIIRIESDVIYLPPMNAEVAQVVLKYYEKINFISEISGADAIAGLLNYVKLFDDPAKACDTLNGVFCQKLIRLLCNECRTPFRPNPKILAKTGLPPETKVLYRPPSKDDNEDGEEPDTCENCGGTGYVGLTGMVELIEMNEEIKNLIIAGGNPAAIRTQAKKDNMPNFRADGLRLVAEGKTSLEELQRVFTSAPTG